MWYTRFLVHFKSVKNVFIRYFGTYAPLWVITFLVGWYNMDKKLVENDDGDLLDIKMGHIEFVAKQDFSIIKQVPTYQDSSEDSVDDNADHALLDADTTVTSDKVEPVTYTRSYHYDVTTRALWYLYFNEYYDEFCSYIRGCMPFDLNEHLFSNANIVFRYSGNIDGILHVRTTVYDMPKVVYTFFNDIVEATPVDAKYVLVDNMTETEHPVMYNTISFP